MAVVWFGRCSVNKAHECVTERRDTDGVLIATVCPHLNQFWNLFEGTTLIEERQVWLKISRLDWLFKK